MASKFLATYFPPPKSLQPPHLGISFSDSNLKAIMFDGSASHPHFKSVIDPLPPGTIVSGVIVHMDEVVKHLGEMRKSFDISSVFFTIPDELTYLFSATVPYTKGANLSESISFIIEENVPHTLAETVFDFVPTKIVPISETEFKVSVLVSACMTTEIEKFTTAIRDGGFEPVGCINESAAIAKAIIKDGSAGVSCIIHARSHRLSINLVRDTTVVFSSVSPISEGVPYEKQILDEYEKFFEYYLKYESSNKEPIQMIFVSGEFEYARQVTTALMKSTHYENNVKLANVWNNVLSIKDTAPNITYEDSLNLAGPIGAVLSPIM